MKFSHSLQFNAVPEWSSKYIAYTTLKKLIYSLQRDNLRRTYQQDDEATLEGSHLIGANYASMGQTQDESASAVFIAALDAELKKIDTFYQQQEGFIFSNMNDLMNDIDNFEREVDESLALPEATRIFKVLLNKIVEFLVVHRITTLQTQRILTRNSLNQKMMTTMTMKRMH